LPIGGVGFARDGGVDQGVVLEAGQVHKVEVGAPAQSSVEPDLVAALVRRCGDGFALGWVAVLEQHTLDEAAEVRAHVLPLGPVDRHITLHGLHQLPSDPFQGRLAEHLHRAVVGLQGVVEGEFFFGEP